MAKLPRTFHEHVVYAATVRLTARILTQSRINSNRGTLATFSPHSLASSSSSSSHAPPRALRENLENPSLSLCASSFVPALHGQQRFFPINDGVERSRGEAGELHHRAARRNGHPHIGGDGNHRR